MVELEKLKELTEKILNDKSVVLTQEELNEVEIIINTLNKEKGNLTKNEKA